MKVQIFDFVSLGLVQLEVAFEVDWLLNFLNQYSSANQTTHLSSERNCNSGSMAVSAKGSIKRPQKTKAKLSRFWSIAMNTGKQSKTIKPYWNGLIWIFSAVKYFLGEESEKVALLNDETTRKDAR